MLLQALVACAGVTLGAVATSMGLVVRGGNLTAEGDLDFRGTLGVAKEAAGGIPRHPPADHLDTDAAEPEKRKLLELTERYCVVYQTLVGHPTVRMAYAAEGGA